MLGGEWGEWGRECNDCRLIIQLTVASLCLCTEYASVCIGCVLVFVPLPPCLKLTVLVD